MSSAALGYLLIALGGGAGALCRYAAGVVVATNSALLFPWATLAVNIAGAWAIGLVWGVAGGSPWFESWGRALIVTGFLGGFTTFSAFSYETLQMMQSGRVITAATYVLVSVVLCVLAVWLGHLAAALIAR